MSRHDQKLRTLGASLSENDIRSSIRSLKASEATAEVGISDVQLHHAAEESLAIYVQPDNAAEVRCDLLIACYMSINRQTDRNLIDWVTEKEQYMLPHALAAIIIIIIIIIIIQLWDLTARLYEAWATYYTQDHLGGQATLYSIFYKLESLLQTKITHSGTICRWVQIQHQSNND